MIFAPSNKPPPGAFARQSVFPRSTTLASHSRLAVSTQLSVLPPTKGSRALAGSESKKMSHMSRVRGKPGLEFPTVSKRGVKSYNHCLQAHIFQSRLRLRCTCLPSGKCWQRSMLRWERGGSHSAAVGPRPRRLRRVRGPQVQRGL